MANEKNVTKHEVLIAEHDMTSSFGYFTIRAGERYYKDAKGSICPERLVSQNLVFFCPDCGNMFCGGAVVGGKRVCMACEKKYKRVGEDFFTCSIIYECDEYVMDKNGHYTYKKNLDKGAVIICERCGNFSTTSRSSRVSTAGGGQTWCGDCVYYHAVRCIDCNKLLDAHVSHRLSGGTILCNDCYNTRKNNGHIYTCEHCGREALRSCYNSVLNMCTSCVKDEGRVEQYHASHRGSRKFFGKTRGEQFKGLGIELEVENPDATSLRLCEAVIYIKRILNKDGEPHIFVERDGSLHNGFEVITAPHTLSEFSRLDIEGACDKLKSLGFTSHNAGTCGLHVHISRAMFGETSEARDRAMAKVSLFYSIFWEDILKASRRTQGQADRWAGRYVIHNRGEAEDYIKYNNFSRYVAVNFCNDNTVEFRLGRGTLNAASIRAWVDLHYTLVQNSRRIPWEKIADASEWLKGINPETAVYLLRRGAFTEALNKNNEEV